MVQASIFASEIAPCQKYKCISRFRIKIVRKEHGATWEGQQCLYCDKGLFGTAPTKRCPWIMNVTITDIRPEDDGTYYCARSIWLRCVSGGSN